jgi:glycosyltransferase involved in cell wall biosynthesis
VHPEVRDSGNRRTRVALITHELTGGVGTMTRFLYGILKDSARYEPSVIVLATSASDPASVLVRDPSTWLTPPKVVRGIDREMPYTLIGAWLAEFEFQRYRPRRALGTILNEFDIIQFVAGAAPWVEAAEEQKQPKCLWVATTISGDRKSLSAAPLTARRVWTSIMTRIAQTYERRALQQADSVLALSPYTIRSLAPMLGGKDARLAFCGVDTNLFHPRDQSAVTSSDGYILCVARLFDARKNVAMLLRAYASLMQMRPDIPDLRLVGEPLSDEGRQILNALGIAGKVHCDGPTHGEDLANIYRGAAFFVLPSDEEGLGIVILEAMATALAVVSTASGGPEVAVTDGETGFLTPVGDQEALKSAMLKLIDDPDLRDRFGAAGRRVAEARFSLESTGAVFLREYDRLLT